ncbi:RecQ family ATP-dependent DNA helicase [Flavobacteriaceae bacterium]|nr:RecQ family ATP-dependent DNA helicase [Flavobacteriaceae bacterium]
MISPAHILQKYWGHSSFRDSQEDVIEAVLDKKDVVTILPTGGGKSVCYQVPGLILEGVCLVISPLISLMNDQTEQLRNNGIKALTIKSKATTDEIVSLFDNLKFGQYKFLYVSPERLQSDLIIQKIKEININLIAVDEAHCISEWGHDFRPSYRLIHKVRDVLPTVNMIALTATATKKVVEDIIENLNLSNTSIFKKSFYRKNLAYQIIKNENKLGKLEQIFKKNPFPTIIYVNSRKKTEDISNFINAKGYLSTFYHGGMTTESKTKAFNSWIKEDRLIMVATNAFGMGIDKPNVKVVIHLDLPASIENYVQEAGRAGRNGEKSFSVVLQNENDINSFKKNTLETIPSINEIKNVHRKLYQYFQIALGELPEISFDFNFLKFCQTYKFSHKKTAAIFQILKKNNIIEINSKFSQRSTVIFIISSKQLLRQTFNNKLTRKLIDFILRSHGGIFQKEVKINEFDIAKRMQINSLTVRELLNRLDHLNIINYKEASSNEEFTFLTPREDDKTINKISKSIEKYLNQQQKKSEELICFVKNNTTCRCVQLSHYFNEKKVSKCTHCDVCITEKKYSSKKIEKDIIDLLKDKKEISQEEIIFSLDHDEKAILIHLRNLLYKDKIGLTTNNKFFIS